MRHRFIALLVLFTVIFFSSAEAQTTARKFEAGKNTFLLDGKPFVVKAAELHYTSISPIATRNPSSLAVTPAFSHCIFKYSATCNSSFVPLACTKSVLSKICCKFIALSKSLVL